MTKRFFSILTFVFLLLSPIIAHADVVMGNDFFYEIKDKTKPMTEGRRGKRIIINSPLGYVIPKVKPGSKEGVPTGEGYHSGTGYKDIENPKHDVFVFKNGLIFTIEATYLYKGEYWGVMSPSHMYQPSGWILMSDLLVFYEKEDFEIENNDNFYIYTGSYDAVLSAERLVQWQWPGSDKEKRVIDDTGKIHLYANVHFAYKDAEGREWGKSKYSEWWICLSDPENSSNIPAFNPTPEPRRWVPPNDDKNLPQSSTQSGQEDPKKGQSSTQTRQEPPGNRSRRAGCGSGPPK